MWDKPHYATELTLIQFREGHQRTPGWTHLKELELCLVLFGSVVVAVQLGEFLLHGALVQPLHNISRKVVLRPKIGLSMELRETRNMRKTWGFYRKV